MQFSHGQMLAIWTQQVILNLNVSNKDSWPEAEWSGSLLPTKDKGPIVQSMVSLTSLLVVKMLTVLVSSISNSQYFFLKKCE